MGDSIGDLQMADGVEKDSNVLKIGFLNNPATAEKRLPSFLEGYDIVLYDDQTMDVPIHILKQVQGIASFEWSFFLKIAFNHVFLL